MNILLANPRSSSAFQAFGFVFPSLGLLYVAASAEKEGYRIKVEDFNISKNNPASLDVSGFDIVGITSDTRRFPSAVEIAQRAKEKGRCVVMGGVHPPFVDEEILKAGYADFVVKGEGEITFPALLNAIKLNKDLQQIDGISFLKDGKIIRTKPRALIENLDSLPSPARHLIDIEAYKRAGFRYGGKRPIAVISTSRGCPYTCSFCLTPAIYGRGWRARSAHSIIAEIEELYHKYNYRAIAFCDDNFTVSPKRVIEVSNLIMEKGLDIWWWCLSSPNILLKNEDMLSIMAKSGAKTIYIGVESASPATLKEFNKSMEEDTAYKAVNLLKKNGIQIFASYIIGGLNDDIKAILRTIKLAKRLDTEVAQFSILTPYPGTGLYEQIKHILRHKDWGKYDGVHLVFRHKNISYVFMQLLLILAYLSFYVRGVRAVKGFLSVFIKNTPIFKTRLKRWQVGVGKDFPASQ
ncbi:MAG: hypothetical protein A3G39_08720 [Deltaproteobacteria bacterium RIFCSPLOWO2_12_FULL_43_16]|nr:MAG: hypothetical protein A2Z89_01120 [Deltaproteobacteria bacterium GWA2_43_19]OGQ09734.1 MAG: hypothetical protein A3D30_00715 [Deltaproteobacteria bacterium RIFCSPHIGHO2_02_FULL_43_33]OGQ44841.1 MAG: hypothetical protein A2W63_02620 [Deltaproteobacteria bacterium RIFCSPLOWO2_02_44_9]OGQ60258.1 MAG: hypothetical protein A3G39_08720 [Deltaproteobacteria bacterium RIFCSPLOWO2_12_FULL_43_16]HBR16065.1 B12-binding domain-containing radical SAM protein [Deltaproteobacteria bacterium]